MRNGLALATCEDVFLGIRSARTDQTAAGFAASLLSSGRVERVIALRDQVLGYPLARRACVRVIVRVRDERRFLRTQLRGALTRAAQAIRPDWRTAEQADVEIWAVEWRRGEMISTLRLSDIAMRQGDGRLRERPGALRPVVARAMLRSAGPQRGILLDPCCGCGTILHEAGRAGWTPRPFDIDEGAVAAPSANAPAAEVSSGVARQLPVADHSATAVVSNLPFGDQYQIDGDPRAWLGDVLGEIRRVLAPRGTVVLLHPLQVPARHAGLVVKGSTRLTVLGKHTTHGSSAARERTGLPFADHELSLSAGGRLPARLCQTTQSARPPCAPQPGQHRGFQTYRGAPTVTEANEHSERKQPGSRGKTLSVQLGPRRNSAMGVQVARGSTRPCRWASRHHWYRPTQLASEGRRRTALQRCLWRAGRLLATGGRR